MTDGISVTDLSWRARKRLVAETAEAILRARPGVAMKTKDLARAVARVSGVAEAVAGADLVKFAGLVPWARKTGETFVNLQGRLCHRREWVWTEGMVTPDIGEKPRAPNPLPNPAGRDYSPPDEFVRRQVAKEARHVAAAVHGFSITYDPADPAAVLAARTFAEWVEMKRVELEFTIEPEDDE